MPDELLGEALDEFAPGLGSEAGLELDRTRHWDCWGCWSDFGENMWPVAREDLLETRTLPPTNYMVLEDQFPLKGTFGVFQVSG